ncbi:MAG: GatB/YqeY domain-containing protein [Bacteroidetes bacterium]|nr:GatB/YqeY domain-containing protein [Bacteroidota bacterium]
MSLDQIITEQMKAAMKSGDRIRLDTVRSIRAAILEFNTSGANRALTEEDELKIVQKLAKKRKDSIEIYKTHGRIEAAEKEQQELTILEEFLPKQMEEFEIKSIIQKIINDTGATNSKDFGKVIGSAMKELRGKADGTIVQTIVKSLLEN